jgi:hypothetical protein
MQLLECGDTFARQDASGGIAPVFAGGTTFFPSHRHCNASRWLFTAAASFTIKRAKTELKGLMPDDAKEAFGHGIRAKRSKSGAVSFEVIEVEATNAPVE